MSRSGRTHVAPATNISTVLALATADNAVIRSIVVLAITKTRIMTLPNAMHMTLGINRKATMIEAMRTRAVIVIEGPENICTFESLDTTWERGCPCVSTLQPHHQTRAFNLTEPLIRTDQKIFNPSFCTCDRLILWRSYRAKIFVAGQEGCLLPRQAGITVDPSLQA